MNRCVHHHRDYRTQHELSSYFTSSNGTTKTNNNNNNISNINNITMIEANHHLHIQSHHNTSQRWSSSSSNICRDDRCNSSSVHDKPIHCPLRRRSIDSNTSSISSTSNYNRRNKTRSSSDACTYAPIRLPTFISFESTITSQRDTNSEKKHMMPPKYPKRTKNYNR